MSLKSFALIVGALVACLLAYVAYLLAAPWEAQTVGPFQTRRHRLTGQVQLREADTWVKTLGDAPSGPNSDPVLDEAALRKVRLTDLAWGEKGLLCGRAINSGPTNITGRLAFRIIVYDKNGIINRDRSLRRNADWPAQKTTPFLINTGLSAPGFREHASVGLEIVR